jgi:putative holliday junction resolvase
MKILALDLGDKWVGSAISDTLRITCRPLETVELKNLDSFLEKILNEESISMIIVGHPKTFEGGQSAQTKKIELQKKDLEKKFPKIEWVLWDERLSSKRAEDKLGKSYRTKQGKRESHSVAAAFILQSYLDNQVF